MVFKQLRRSIRPILWAVAIGFVASLFLMYGISTRQGKEESLVEVNGVPISYASFIQNYRSVYERYQQSLKGEITPQIENYLKYRVLSQLVTNELLYQEAKKAKIKVSEDEVTDEVKKIMRNFRSEDNFMRFLQYQHISYADFKEEIRRQLLIDRLIQAVKDSVVVTDEEVKDYWIAKNEKVKVEYLLIRPEKYKNEVKLSEEEIKKYYQDYKENFTVPEKVKVNYILINPEDFRKKVKVTEDALKQYYEEHLSDYKVPERRRVSHILIYVKPDATEEEEKKAEEKIKQLQEKLKEGADFAELAKKYSEDPSTAEKGGDLGYFTKAQMFPGFSEVAFSLQKVGDVSDIVRTPLGYHLIKLTGIEPAHTRTFEEVKKIVKARFIQEKSWELARKEAERARKEMEKMEIGFDGYAKKYPERLKSTPFFARNEEIKGLGWVPEFSQIAFSLKKGKISPLVETPQGYCILSLAEKKPSYIPPFEEVKEKVKEELTEKKTIEIAEKKAREIKKMLDQQSDLSLLAKKMDLEHENLDYFTREDWIGGISATERKKFIETAFSLRKGELSEPILLSNGYYIIKLLAREIPLEKFSEEKEEFAKKLLAQKVTDVTNRWFQRIREEAKIVDNSHLLFSP